MKMAFITGIPASGKSWLASRVAQKLKLKHYKVDDWRVELRSDPKLLPWVNFFWNQNEQEYWKKTTFAQHWDNLVAQSEALWPEILKRIRQVENNGVSAIIEGVSLLPHLARRDLKFDGLVLLGESFDVIYQRDRRKPRWGKTADLENHEVDVLWECERRYYRHEAEQYGYEAFTDMEKAEQKLIKILHE